MNKRGQGGSELRVQEKRSHDRATAANLPIICGKTQVSKATRRPARFKVRVLLSWTSHLRENFYTESETNSIGLLDSGTMKYRPPFVTVGREKNKPYHPVKPLCSTMRETIGRQCHRWLPSPVVQMLKKVRNTSSA